MWSSIKWNIYQRQIHKRCDKGASEMIYFFISIIMHVVQAFSALVMICSLKVKARVKEFFFVNKNWKYNLELGTVNTFTHFCYWWEYSTLREKLMTTLAISFDSINSRQIICMVQLTINLYFQEVKYNCCDRITLTLLLSQNFAVL